MEGQGFEEVRIMVCVQRGVKPVSNLWGTFEHTATWPAPLDSREGTERTQDESLPV
jgi:hypothetical protein